MTATDHGRLAGQYPALVTPLTPERSVHPADLETLVTRALEDAADGVLIAGSTGEGTLLEPEQRVEATRITRTVLDEIHRSRSTGSGPNTPPTLLAGASGASVSALHDDVSRLAGAGADIVLVLAPSTYPLGSDELVELHLEVAERSPVPTLIYHIPQYTGSSLLPDAIGEVGSHPRIVGMKDSSPDADRRTRFIAAARTMTSFAVLTGHAPSLHVALQAGASGSMTAIANVRQRQVVRLHAAVEAGDETEAALLQAALTRTTEALAGIGPSLPATLKAALQLEGVLSERWCRPPLRSVGPDQLDQVRTALMR